MNYFGGTPDNPNTAGYNPQPEVGPFLNPHTDDNKISASIWTLDGENLSGSVTSGDPQDANDTNYFMSFLSGAAIPDKKVSIQFHSHGCSVPTKFYIVGTDVDGGEQYDATALLAQGWVEAPENQVTGVNGIYAGNANDSETFALMWDVEANGMPPAGELSGSTTFGQSVLILLADYYCPLENKGTDDCLKLYNCDGVYEGDYVEASEIGAECCANCPEPNFYTAPTALTPEQQIAEGPFTFSYNRKGWLFPWTPTATANTGTITEDWEELGSSVLPTTEPTDLKVDFNMGHHYFQSDGCRSRVWMDARLMINGSAVKTWSLQNYKYIDERGNSLLQLEIDNTSSVHWDRKNVPAGATVAIEVRRRTNMASFEANGNTRVISGLRAHGSGITIPRNIVVGRT